jgi:hypothetical protein
MDNRLTPGQNEIIEESLRSYPTVALPRSLTLDVISLVRSTPAPRFRITRYDLILVLVLTLVCSSMFAALQLLPVQVVLQLRIQAILFWQSLLVNACWLVPMLFFGLAAVLAGLTLPTLYRMTMNRGR